MEEERRRYREERRKEEKKRRMRWRSRRRGRGRGRKGGRGGGGGRRGAAVSGPLVAPDAALTPVKVAASCLQFTRVNGRRAPLRKINGTSSWSSASLCFLFPHNNLVSLKLGRTGKKVAERS